MGLRSIYQSSCAADHELDESLNISIEKKNNESIIICHDTATSFYLIIIQQLPSVAGLSSSPLMS